MQATEQPYLTEAEFTAAFPDDRFLELFDGEVVVTAAVRPVHQLVSAELYVMLRRWAEAQTPPWQAYYAPLDIRFGPDRILQPDLMLFDVELPRDAPRLVTTIPRLTVEIVSPSSVAYDRFAKRVAYAQAGVTAYLVVDPGLGQAEVFHGEGLRRRQMARSELVVPGLEGLRVDLDRVFGRG